MEKKLFVGGLKWETDDESLGAYFEPFGTVLEAVVVKDRDTGRSRGFGFVKFANEEDAMKVLENPAHEIDGRQVRIDEASDRDSGGGRGGRGGYSGGGGYRGGGGGGYRGGGGGGYSGGGYQGGGYGGRGDGNSQAGVGGGNYGGGGGYNRGEGYSGGGGGGGGDYQNDGYRGNQGY